MSPVTQGEAGSAFEAEEDMAETAFHFPHDSEVADDNRGQQSVAPTKFPENTGIAETSVSIVLPFITSVHSGTGIVGHTSTVPTTTAAPSSPATVPCPRPRGFGKC